MQKLIPTTICLVAFAASIGIVIWSVVAPLPYPEPTTKPGAELPLVNLRPRVDLADFDSLLSKRLQGKPLVVETEIKAAPPKPVVNLPAQLKLTAIMFANSDDKDMSMATFSTALNQSVNCMVGEKVLDAKVVAIDEKSVRLLFRETEFTVKIEFGRRP